VRGLGARPTEAFEQGALAMTAVITDPMTIRSSHAIVIACEAPSLELLLYKWLNSLVFEMATRSELFGAFEVTIEGSRLKAVARGEKVDRSRHAPAVEVKGAIRTSWGLFISLAADTVQ